MCIIFLYGGKFILLLLCREDGDNEFMNIVANKLTEKVRTYLFVFVL